MKVPRILALVLGSLLALPALALLVSGVGLALASIAQRDNNYFDVTLDRLTTSTAAITVEDIDFRVEPGTPRWVLDALDTDIRLKVTPADADDSIFLGIAEERDLDQYLSGIGHEEITDVNDDLEAEFVNRSGDDAAPPPTDQDFWEVSVEGTETQELEWEAQSGRWAVALMNADGTPGVDADVNVGVRSAALVPAAVGLLIAGGLLAAIAVTLIVFGGLGLGGRPPTPEGQPVDLTGPPPTGAPAEGVRDPVAAGLRRYPVALEARLDPALSNWKWLVKWIMAIPHFIILCLLWVAFCLLTIVAGVSILFTGRYPRSIFDFNVGVLRWGWRVSYYAASGGLGTDQYPPFTLDHDPTYPATLSVDYPEQLSRGLVLIKWWLLAIPHYVIVAVLAGGGYSWSSNDGWSAGWGTAGGGGLLAILTLVAAVILLFTSQYPKQLFDLIVGLNRWVYRVIAYAALMTDQYPPFHLDQGGSEPPVVQPDPQGPADGDTTAVSADPTVEREPVPAL